MSPQKPELLSPAGDFEKLRAAVRYGADAVYLAGEAFGMRAASQNFTREELKEAVSFTHENGVKLYVTVNVMPRTEEYAPLREYLTFLGEIGVDAVIVSDIGVLVLVKEVAPSLEIHISTQASAVSAAACTAWYNLGAKRVVLARELTMAEIVEIRKNTPPELELEAFVHGAMCIAYSGRCLLSNYFVGRDANHGRCAQPCRWIYNERVITEEKRPDDRITVEEHDGDSFVMSSRDTCMIEHIPALMESGITSFKIEGRVKSAYYTAVVTNTYKMAIDAYLRDPASYENDPLWLRELESVSHREYYTGFYFTPPHENANTVTAPGYIREKAYLATAITDSDENGFATFIQRNKLTRGDSMELLTPGKVGVPFVGGDLFDEAGEAINAAPHPLMKFTMYVPVPVRAGDIIRQG